MDSIALVALLVGLNLYAPASPSILQRILATSIIVIAFAVVRAWKGRQRDFWFMPVLLFVYALFYAVPIFLLPAFGMDGMHHTIDDWAVTKALALALVGLVGIIGGYCVRGRLTVRLRWPDTAAVEIVALAIGILGLASFVVVSQMRPSDSTQAWLNLPGEFLFLSAIALFALQLVGKAHLISIVTLWSVLIPGRLVFGMAQGRFAMGFSVVVSLVLTYAAIRRKVPWAFLFVGVALFCIMQPLKASLRQSVYLQGDMNPELDYGSKFSALSDMPTMAVNATQIYGLNAMIGVASARLADIMVLASAVSHTPDPVPYWYGESYLQFLTLPIPRFLYPDKPTYLPGNVFGHRYGLLGPEDFRTSINLTQLTELYVNFGPIAVFLGSILIGLLYRTTNDALTGNGLGALVAGIYIFGKLADIENSSIAVFGALLMNCIVIGLFHCAVIATSRIRHATRSAPAIARSRRWATGGT